MEETAYFVVNYLCSLTREPHRDLKRFVKDVQRKRRPNSPRPSVQVWSKKEGLGLVFDVAFATFRSGPQKGVVITTTAGQKRLLVGDMPLKV